MRNCIDGSAIRIKPKNLNHWINVAVAISQIGCTRVSSVSSKVMSEGLRLAKSDWPRTGRDLRNSALAPFEGASEGTIILDLELPVSGSVVLSESGDFLIAGNGIVAKVASGGELLWKQKLSDFCSAPLALECGLILVNACHRSYLLDAHGQTVRTWEVSDRLEDSGPSPAITRSGHPLLSTCGGGVWLGLDNGVKELGLFGFDTLPPAVLETGEIALAGYYDSGPCLLGADGAVLWKDLDFKEADSLVSSNRFGEIAFGVLNTKQSVVLDIKGARCFESSFVATFSEHPDGWIAVSEGVVRLLSRVGKELWSVRLPVRRGFGLEQAVCDCLGRVYVPCQGGLAALDWHGGLLFRLKTGVEQPRNLALIKDRVVFMCGDRLVLAG